MQDEALKSYGSLVKVQELRYENDTRRTALARAEAYKLQGDVYVAKRIYSRCEKPGDWLHSLMVSRPHRAHTVHIPRRIGFALQ